MLHVCRNTFKFSYLCIHIFYGCQRLSFNTATCLTFLFKFILSLQWSICLCELEVNALLWVHKYCIHFTLFPINSSSFVTSFAQYKEWAFAELFLVYLPYYLLLLFQMLLVVFKAFTWVITFLIPVPWVIFLLEILHF